MADTPRSSGIARGIRARTTLIAVLAVAITLGVAGAVLVGFVRATLRENAETEARVRATAIVAELTTRGSFTPGDPDEEFVQVLSADGAVVASSPNVEGRPAVVSIAAGHEVVLDAAPIPDAPALVLSRAVTVDGRPATLLLGRSLEVVWEATGAVVSILVVVLPALLVVVGVLTWILVGRVLAPVEAIRREVEAISPAELHRRVPDPPGHDEIARLAGTMNAMLTRLDDGQRRERRLVSDASHELRSPIAAIRQHAEVAIAHPDASSLPELARTVLEEDLRLQRIVDDLLLLASSDEGSLRRMDPVDLDDVVFDEARRIRGTGSIRVDVHRVSSGRVVGDRSSLERLVRNLTDNARRHARSVVELALHETDGHVVLSVEDDGAGVPEGDRSRIFERFVRVDDARDREAGGSGLGLAIVWDIATAHGGSVRVTDGALGGARFEVEFPATDDLDPSGSFRGRSDPGRQDPGDPDGAPVDDPRRRS